MISVNDIYWAAGFLEGEGSFYSDSVKGILAASQVQREPLDHLQELFGGTITLIIRKRGGKSKDIFLWKLRGWYGIGVMLTLYCLLSLKRKTQIKRVLGKWKGALRFNKKPEPFTPQFAFEF